MGDLSAALTYMKQAMTANWWTTGEVLTFIIIGIVILRLGLVELWSIQWTNDPANPLLGTRSSQFGGWRIFKPSVSEDINTQLLLQRNLVFAHREVGLGAGVLVGTCAYAGFALGLVTSHRLPGFGGIGTLLTAEAILVGALLGAIMGYLVGLRAVRRKMLDPAPPVGPRRSPGDYAAPWLWTIPMLVCGTAAFLLFKASIGAPTIQIRWYGAPVSISAPIVGAFFAATYVLAAILLPLVAARLARSPNALASSDHQAAQLANDDLRASTSGTFANTSLWIVALAANDMDPLRSALGFPALAGLYGILWNVTTFVGAAMFIAIIPIVVMTVTGRSGGRLTGWWWQRRPALRLRPTPEEG